MTSRSLFFILSKAGLVVCAFLVVGVLLAAMPGHRAPALQQQATSPQPVSEPAMSDMHRDHMDMSDERASEQHAVHDMAPGHHHMPGAHMQMTALRPRTAADKARAQQVVEELRGGIEKYRDYHAAFADGYKIFLPNLPQPEYHFTSYKNGFLQAFSFDPARPTSLLYKKTATGYELAGAMYTMPKIATEEKLNSRVPLSVASWHLHTNLCMPARDQIKTADWTRFGLRGSISTEEACEAAGGRFRPSIFGWMVHVYPYEDSLDKVFTH